ncbi:MAG TPA: 50S ribosomal protein L30 [Steroidobacteraceae bacterium]|nr:50S ribosomal protein L30 [Steroidobacteraceae bacterium]
MTAVQRKEVKVTLVKSLHGQLANIAASARGLGLRRIHQTVSVVDTPENRGMIKAAEHLLKVERTS